MTHQIALAALSVGDEAPVVSHLLNLTDLVKYAGASGDFHPLHYDDKAAAAMGMNGVIGHGMFSAGLLTRAITDYVGIENVAQLRFRFLSPTRPGETLTTSVKVVGVTGGGDARAVELVCSLANSSGDIKVSASALARRRHKEPA